MGAVSRQRVPLKKMREVLHAGQRLGVDIPEVEQLRLDIRRREWEDQAKKVPSRTSCHLQCLYASAVMLMLPSCACHGISASFLSYDLAFCMLVSASQEACINLCIPTT